MAGLGLETIKKAWRLVRRVAFRPKIVPFTGVKKKKKRGKKRRDNNSREHRIVPIFGKIRD